MNPLRPLRSRYASRDLNELHDEQLTLGDRLADALARFGGCWTFIIAFCGALVLWVGLNNLQLLVTPFDPFPYVVLNLVLSCLAAIQAPIILMSLNRQAARDRLAAELDHERNTKANLDVEQLHEKLDLLRETQWLDLVELQQHQIALLRQVLSQQNQPMPPVPGTGEPITLPPSTSTHDDTSSGQANRPRRARIVDGQNHVRRRCNFDELGQARD